MSFADIRLTAEETKRVFDAELDKARQDGRVPDFVLHALRREAVLRAEIFQMLLEKLTTWLQEETELRREVGSIHNSQAGALADLDTLTTCTGQLLAVVRDVLEELGALNKEVGLLSVLFRESQSSLARWHRDQTEERGILLEGQRILHEKLGEQAKDIFDIKEHLGDLNQLLGERIGEAAAKRKADEEQNRTLDTLRAQQDSINEEVTGIHKKAEKAELTAAEAKAEAQKAWIAAAKKTGAWGTGLYTLASLLWEIYKFFASNPPKLP